MSATLIGILEQARKINFGQEKFVQKFLIPRNIDRLSRILFPLIFICFNCYISCYFVSESIRNAFVLNNNQYAVLMIAIKI